MTKRLFQVLMLCLLMPVLGHAQTNSAVAPAHSFWDAALYKQIEQSIRVPQFADKTYLITKYGAKTDATAAKNQKAIQKAMARW